MKFAALIPLMLLLAGCTSPKHSYYTAQRPHVERDQIIAESNRFPTPGHQDSYSWYQKDNTRNMRLGGESGNWYQYGPTGENAGWPTYYGPAWNGYGGGWGGYGGWGGGVGLYGGYGGWHRW